MKITAVIAFFFFPSCLAYPSYPPTYICESLAVRHHHIDSQAPDTSPYSITATPGNYTPGSQITVRITGTIPFKGFIIQARKHKASTLPYPLGTFTGPVPDYSQHMWCSGGEPRHLWQRLSHGDHELNSFVNEVLYQHVTVSCKGPIGLQERKLIACEVREGYWNTVGHNHTRYYNFTSVELLWVAPDTPVGNITFSATIVKNFEVFWTMLQSNIVTGQPGLPPTTPTLGANFQITKEGCTITKGCYSEPPSCTGSEDCIFLVTYKDSGDRVEFEMSSNLGYAAMGFNSKQKMDETDSITCSTSATGAVELRQYYLDRYFPVRQDLCNSSDIAPLEKSYTDGIVKCRFSRKKIPQGSRMRDLNDKLYFIFAWGSVSSTGVLDYHRDNASYSVNPVDVTNPAILTNGKIIPPAPTPSPGDQVTKTDCGSKKGCYSEPTTCQSCSNCQYLVTYAVNKDDVMFELCAKTDWTAVGFNNKPKMDGTDSIICARKPSEVSVGVAHYKVEGYERPTKYAQDPSPLNVVYGQYEGGVIRCKFSRKRKATAMMDLTAKVFLIFARGKVSRRRGRLRKHSHTSQTLAPVDITYTGPLVTGQKDITLLRAHAIVMTIAWLVFASLAIFVARYMREVWGELFGLKAWFQIHRSLMFLALVFTIIGVVLAFVYVEGWSETDLAHPVIGIIVLVLSCVQPVMAFFRPKPGTDERVIFNWAHRSVGVVTLVLAVVNCFLGVLQLPHLNIQAVGVYPLIVYCIGVALVMVFECVLMVKNKSTDYASVTTKVDLRDETVQLQTTAPPEPTEQYKALKKMMFAFVCILFIGASMALTVFLAGGPPAGK